MVEGKIKQGYHFYIYYWTIPAFLLFFFVNYFLRRFSIENLDISLMISVVSFLLGFLISITFSMILARVSSLKVSLAEETGRLVSLYLLSKHLGKDFFNKIKERIDIYTIKTLRDYTEYEIGREDIYEIHNELSLMEIKNDFQKSISNSFLYVLGEWEIAREKLESLTSRRMEWSLKFSNYILGLILIVLLFLNRGEPFTNTLFVILSTIIVFILLIIEDYDDLRIGDYTINISNSEQLFDLIEKERYYPEDILNRVKLEDGRVYRIGIMNKKSKKEIIFRLVHSSKDGLKIKGFKKKVNKIK
jgi:hypothetical protein